MTQEAEGHWTTQTATESRRRLRVDNTQFFPAYVVWELTLRCDLACTHCGSRAGKERARELTVEEAFRVVDDLAAQGAREVVLIGGEAYLHDGFLAVIQRLAAKGVAPTLTTGGRGITAELAQAMKQAGMTRVSVSIDGLPATHDAMRNFRGSYRLALEALRHCREAGIRVTTNTNLNRFNRADLEPLYEVLRQQQIVSWQVQLTTPLGRAADRTNMTLQPYDLLDLLPRIAALKSRAFDDGIRLMPGNNLGYFGPEEGLLRSLDRKGEDHFRGCQAGRYVMGIESDGVIKGCPSLQTAAYAAGSVLERPLAEIWADAPLMALNRARGVESLWGFCKTCPFADTCLGGCTFTAHAFFGRPGNNPFCHFRAQEMQRRGLRERLIPGEAAPGQPFDNGRFELVEEPFDSPEPETESGEKLLKITRRHARGPQSA
jgi:radical SAM protein with 4Fe4S-binding SPASM domain